MMNTSSNTTYSAKNAPFGHPCRFKSDSKKEDIFIRAILAGILSLHVGFVADKYIEELLWILLLSPDPYILYYTIL